MGERIAAKLRELGWHDDVDFMVSPPVPAAGQEVRIHPGTLERARALAEQETIARDHGGRGMPDTELAAAILEAFDIPPGPGRDWVTRPALSLWRQRFTAEARAIAINMAEEVVAISLEALLRETYGIEWRQ